MVAFHVTNLLIHAAAGLILLGLLRRTLLRPELPAWLRDCAGPFATAVALLWTVHPLQTESVTYVVQRVESLMGLCFLFTLYAFARSTSDPRPARWRGLAVAACVAGSGCKEVIAVAPLLVLLYDRAFVSGSVRVALQRHRGMYAGLAATWLILLGAGPTGSRRDDRQVSADAATTSALTKSSTATRATLARPKSNRLFDGTTFNDLRSAHALLNGHAECQPANSCQKPTVSETHRAR